MAFTISAPAFLRQPLFRAPVIDPFRVKPTGVPAFRGRCPRLLYESPSGIRGHHDPHAGTTLGLRCLSSPRDPGLTSGSVACRHAPDGPNLDAHSPLIAGSHRVMPSGSEVVIACAVLLKNVAARPLSPNLVFHNVPHMRAARSPYEHPLEISLLTACCLLLSAYCLLSSYEHPLVDPQFMQR